MKTSLKTIPGSVTASQAKDEEKLIGRHQSRFNEHLRPSDASRYLGVSESKLAKLRMLQNRHLGPKFVRAAGCIIYRKRDLDEWIAKNLIEV